MAPAPGRMARPALDVGIVCADGPRLVAFYRDAFGFEVLPALEIPGVGTIHKLRCGESTLRLMVPVRPPAPDDAERFDARAGLRYLTLEVVDAQEAAEAVRAAGGRITLEPFTLRPGRVVAQVTDPDGNMIEIGQGEG